MSREPLWKLADLINHYGITASEIGGIVVNHPLPEPVNDLPTSSGLYFKSHVAKARKNKYKRSELIHWYQLNRKK